MTEIYFDNSATTRICEEALAVYCRTATDNYGNPSSRHKRGLMAEDALKAAHKTLLAAMGFKDGKAIFTAGGTEANNLALLGRAHAKARFRRGGRILTSAGEHSSVAHTLDALAQEGFEVIRIPTMGGVIDKAALLAAATPSTVLISVMSVNNETGAAYDLSGIMQAVRRTSPDAVLHIDATQSFLKMPLPVKAWGADMVTVSSHKIEGPKGVGALWVSDALLKNKGLSSIVYGGGQQDALRSGTENLPGICAFAEAARIGAQAMAVRAEQTAALRTYLIESIRRHPVLSGSVVCNLPPLAAPHILSLTVKGLKSETVLNDLSAKGIYVSSGSACSSHDPKLSSALLAFGKTPDEADSTVRVSLCYRNTREEIDRFCAALAETVQERAKKH